ncbi:hypothetical protein QN277_006988 [Acacia crassicarpa]|uniref:RING-type E3 ubiquitin transferase n=1 Tax=Acacia crassicarpa TaxID=499986 RepID=A0AAE1M9E5_9FABA|nr:hypothetical protein QN277_006988 [Acacia crassicarpa]
MSNQFDLNGQVRSETIRLMLLDNEGVETTILLGSYDSDMDDDDEVEEAGIMVNPATQKSIESLEKVRIEEPTLCSICFQDILSNKRQEEEEEEEEAVQIPKPCGHVYHLNCILKWFNKHNTCPLCRRKIPS